MDVIFFNRDMCYFIDSFLNCIILSNILKKNMLFHMQRNVVNNVDGYLQILNLNL
jgi:hypothetical protein